MKSHSRFFGFVQRPAAMSTLALACLSACTTVPAAQPQSADGYGYGYQQDQPSPTEQRVTDAAGGAVAGAGLGAIIGAIAHSKHIGRDAALGAGAGVVGGALLPVSHPSGYPGAYQGTYQANSGACRDNATGEIGTAENLGTIEGEGGAYDRVGCVAPNGAVLSTEMLPVAAPPMVENQGYQNYQSYPAQQSYQPSYSPQTYSQDYPQQAVSETGQNYGSSYGGEPIQ